MTIPANTPEIPEGFINHVLGSFDGEPINSESLRTAMEATWERAHQKDKVSALEAAQLHVDMNALLNHKLERIRTIIRNTLTKRNLTVPAQFKWVFGYGDLTVNGIYRNTAPSYGTPNYISISARASNYKFAQVEDNDFISVRNSSFQTDTMIPLAWLKYSDGRLSSLVRATVRRIADENRGREKDRILKEKAMVEKNLAKLMQQLEQLDAKHKTKKTTA